LGQLQAIAPYRATPVVRPVNANIDVLKQLLDIGVANLLVPMISTAEQARELVTAVRYPPKGNRGIGHALARASRWNRNAGYFAEWEENALIIAQIETKEALANLDEILEVEGIDAYFIGPADLAASLGYPGEMAHPAVVQQTDEAIRTIRRAGKPVGTIAVGEEAAMGFFAKGCSFVAAHVDVLLLAAGADAVAKGVKSRLKQG
jgi:4-hydroxy-2-oxoheptanedioate aldolase